MEEFLAPSGELSAGSCGGDDAPVRNGTKAAVTAKTAYARTCLPHFHAGIFDWRVGNTTLNPEWNSKVQWW
jgi:hypothetical protein